MQTGFIAPRVFLLIPILAVLVLHTARVESTYIPTRCNCPQSKSFIQNATDFEVFAEGVYCSNVEIIMTLKTKEKLCLSPKGKQGARLLKCWKRIQKKGGDKKECLKMKKQPKKKGQKKGTTS